MTSLRWWMMALLMLGSIINYLTRSTLGVAAPTILQDLHITTQQYSWIIGAFQGAIMLQPICGYVLDVVGLKPGFALFAIAWSLISMAHGLAHSWQAFAGLRGLLGFAEGSANPAGMKATAEWFPAKERGLAGGLFNIGASLGSMLAPPLVVWAILTYNWQAAFVITGALGLVWVALWLTFYHSPGRHPTLSAGRARLHRLGPGAAPAEATEPGRRSDASCASAISGASPAALSRRPDLGHADLLGAAVPDHGAAFRSEADRALRLAAVPGRRSRLHVRRRRQPVRCRSAGLSLINARRGAFTLGAVLMMGMAFVGFVDSPYAAIALISLAGFAHQTLSVTVITMSSDLFPRNEVATVAGMAGTCGNAGVLIFSLLIGGAGRDRRLHARSSSAWACSIWSARVLLWTVVREPDAARHVMSTDHSQSDPSRLQSRSVDRARRRRLLHRDLDLRMVSGRADPPLARSGELAAAHAAAHAAPASSNMLRRSRFLRHLGALSHATPTACFYLIYTDVKRYGRTTVAGASGASLRDFHNYLVTSRRRSTANGPIRSTSTAAASIRRCSTTTTAASIWSTCCGTIAPARTASPASCSRNIRLPSGG